MKQTGSRHEQVIAFIKGELKRAGIIEKAEVTHGYSLITGEYATVVIDGRMYKASGFFPESFALERDKMLYRIVRNRRRGNRE